MKNITIVTGPMRSGTSCITGLLEQCGMDLGRTIRVLRNKTEHNPAGHFEADLLVTINSRLLAETPGSLWGYFNIPDPDALKTLADARERYFQHFIRKFDGNLCKDPLLSITLPYWEKNWPQLERAVFCLRHPQGTALSMHRRYGKAYNISTERALTLWEIYVKRFFENSVRSKIYVFDFDVFAEHPVDQLSALLQWLGISLPADEIEKRLYTIFKPEYLRSEEKSSFPLEIPDHIMALHRKIKALSGPLTSDVSPFSWGRNSGLRYGASDDTGASVNIPTLECGNEGQMVR